MNGTLFSVFPAQPANSTHTRLPWTFEHTPASCLLHTYFSSRQRLAASWTVLLSVVGLALYTRWSVMSPGSSSTSAQQLSCGLPSLRSSRTCFYFRSRLSSTIWRLKVRQAILQSYLTLLPCYAVQE